MTDQSQEMQNWLEHTVKYREGEEKSLPLTCFIRGEHGMLFAVGLPVWDDPAMFLYAVSEAVAWLAGPPRAVGFVLEAYLRPATWEEVLEGPPESLEVLSETDPLVNTGFCGWVQVKGEEPSAHLWRLSIEDDGSRWVSEMGEVDKMGEEPISEGLRLLLAASAPEGWPDNLGPEDSRVIFESIASSLPAVGLTADWLAV